MPMSDTLLNVTENTYGCQLSCQHAPELVSHTIHLESFTPAYVLTCSVSGTSKNERQAQNVKNHVERD